MVAPTSPNQVEQGLASLINDHDSGARELATKALQILAGIDPHPPTGLSFWFGSRKCGYLFATCRPSMSSAILTVVAKAMLKIKAAWVEQMEAGWEDLKFETFEEEGLKKMIAIARAVLTSEIKARKEVVGKLGEVLGQLFDAGGEPLEEKPLRILTLSASSSIRSALRHVLNAYPNRKIELRVLESRPKFEGASFATSIVFKEETGKGTKQANVRVTVAPDSHVASLAKDIDIVLLGADRISSSGDVSNKMGSLAAVLCAKALSPTAKVIIVSETDKIATPGAVEDHAEERNAAAEVTDAWDMQNQYALPVAVKHGLMVENVYFEWVPAKYIDIYVTEEGVLDATRIEQVSREKEKLEHEVFDEAVIKVAKNA